MSRRVALQALLAVQRSLWRPASVWVFRTSASGANVVVVAVVDDDDDAII